MMRFLSCLTLSLAVALAGCGSKTGELDRPAAETSDCLVVFTVNYPLAYFAERLGGDEVEVVFPAPSDQDPAFWSPDADTIAAYQSADLILLNGAGYAKWVERATLPSSRAVDSTADVADRLLALEDTLTHSHGPEGAHEHRGWAFTTWLDPTLALAQARSVAAALTTRLPASETVIDQRLTALEADLAALDARLAASAEAIGDEPLLFSHPVYQYLIARYRFNGQQLHWEPDQAPDRAMWTELEHLLDHGASRWMVWEDRPLAATETALAERGITSVVVSPCANRPAGDDWMSVMQSNATVLESIAAHPDG